MNQKKAFNIALIIFIGLLVKETITIASVPRPDNTGRNLVDSSSLKLALKFKLPPQGAPGRRRQGAASRDSCPALANPKEELIALVPETNIGLTVSERPTFWFYVPYNSIRVEFILRDQKDQTLYQQIFPLEGGPGIVGITLPKTVSLSEISEIYSWRFNLICDPNKRENDLFVEGAVERSSLSAELKKRLEKATEIESLAIYAENGLWYDTLTKLIELRRDKPEDKALKQDWEDLWRQVELESMTSQSVLSCCTKERSKL